ncbi:MAG TPA: hypothetical protein VK824_12120, partial [Planctomycetota bacterium]|nr:hypothetical protein [Planctomycetota bacterium]
MVADKPFGPVAVVLEPGPDSAAGQLVHASLAPVRTLTSVTWRWELSPGVVLLHGAPSGSADPRAGQSSTCDVVLLPPAAGRSGQATLLTEATFPGTGDGGPMGPETTVQADVLRWGEQDLSP